MYSTPLVSTLMYDDADVFSSTVRRLASHSRQRGCWLLVLLYDNQKSKVMEHLQDGLEFAVNVLK